MSLATAPKRHGALSDGRLRLKLFGTAALLAALAVVAAVMVLN